MVFSGVYFIQAHPRSFDTSIQYRTSQTNPRFSAIVTAEKRRYIVHFAFGFPVIIICVNM